MVPSRDSEVAGEGGWRRGDGGASPLDDGERGGGGSGGGGSGWVVDEVEQLVAGVTDGLSGVEV